MNSHLFLVGNTEHSNSFVIYFIVRFTRDGITTWLFEGRRVEDEDRIIELVKNDDADITGIDKHCMTLLHYNGKHQSYTLVEALSRS